ncbi:MAG TPA: response regulator, partial [Gammaproteobacteria bacterium]|nr:response regulator [Gammaproteobacteria bacterium]
MITVFLVDDHELVRVALSRLLSEAEDIKVVGEAGSGEVAIQMVRSLKPDVMIM